MKDYLFNKPVPFVKEGDKPDMLANGMSKVFGNDQRNVVLFAFALGIPGLICAFLGLFLSAKGHPILIAFDMLVTLFVAWVFWAMYDIYRRHNKLAEMYNKDEKKD